MSGYEGGCKISLQAAESSVRATVQRDEVLLDVLVDLEGIVRHSVQSDDRLWTGR